MAVSGKKEKQRKMTLEALKTLDRIERFRRFKISPPVSELKRNGRLLNDFAGNYLWSLLTRQHHVVYLACFFATYLPHYFTDLATKYLNAKILTVGFQCS